MRSDRVDVAGLGAAMEFTYGMFLDTVIEQREQGSIPNDQIVDSHFLTLMADPVASLRSLYEQLALEWPNGHDERIRELSRGQAEGQARRARVLVRRRRPRRGERARHVPPLRRALRHHGRVTTSACGVAMSPSARK